MIQKWLAENFYDHVTTNVWLLSSIGFNSQIYYIWDIIKTETYQRAPAYQRLAESHIVMDKMNEKHLIRGCRHLGGHIKAFFDAGVGFIEKPYVFENIYGTTVNKKTLQEQFSDIILRFSDIHWPSRLPDLTTVYCKSNGVVY